MQSIEAGRGGAKTKWGRMMKVQVLQRKNQKPLTWSGPTQTEVLFSVMAAPWSPLQPHSEKVPCSPCVDMGFLRVLQFPPTIQ